MSFNSSTSLAVSSGPKVSPYASLEYSPMHCIAVMVYTALSGVVGTFANSLITAVYIMKQMKCPHEIFMLTVAGINLFGSCVFIPWEIIVVWSGSHSCNNPPNYIIIFSMFLECASALLFLSIALDRYFAICWATHYIMNPKKAMFLSGGSILLSVVLSLVTVVHTKLIYLPHLIYPLVLFLVLGIIIILYLLVFRKVNKQAKKAREQRLKKQEIMQRSQISRAESNNQNEEHDDNTKNVKFSEKTKKLDPHLKIETPNLRGVNGSAKSGDQNAANVGKEKHIMEEMRDKTVKILISVTLVYIFCFVPASIVNFLFFVIPEHFAGMSGGSAMVVKTVQLGYYLNFALSPIVYAALSGRFREDTRVIILKRQPKSVVQERKLTMVTREAEV